MDCFLCNSLSKDEHYRLKRELIRKFTKEIYASCKSFLNARLHFKHKFSDVILPESWDDEVIGYHSTCYKNFRVAPKYLQYLSSDDKEFLAQELLHRITPAMLTALRQSFRRNKTKHADDVDRRIEEVMRVAAAEEGIEFAKTAAPNKNKSLWTDEETFVSSIRHIFGHHKYTTHAHKLFSLLDPFFTRKIWWSDLLDRLVAVGGKSTRGRGEDWTPVEENLCMIKRLGHCKRETIVKLVSIEQVDSFCYAAVTKGGRVGVYDGRLNLLASYHVFHANNQPDRRIKNCWITDAIYMKDVKYLMLSSSQRSLLVYHVATLIHTPLLLITGMPNIPTCLNYEPSITMSGSSELNIGDERGRLTTIKFLQPMVSLFHKEHSDKVNCYFWKELCSPPHLGVYCEISTSQGHARGVRRAAGSGGDVVTCSHDSRASIIYRYHGGLLRDYIFAFPRGITCFHHIPSLQLTVTGDASGFVRLITANVSCSATLRASGRAPILDVAVVPHLRLVLAFTKLCILDIWDLHEECLLQSIKLKFPFLGILGRKVEFGPNSIHPGPLRQSSDLESNSEKNSEEYWTPRTHHTDPEYTRWTRSEVIITSNDHVCVVPLTPPPSDPLPPPAVRVKEIRPEAWETSLTCTRIVPVKEDPASPQISKTLHEDEMINNNKEEFLKFVAEKVQSNYYVDDDIEEMLRKSGLQGILEKDFVKMFGLKRDLNQKLLDIGNQFDKISTPLHACTPHLALTLQEPQEITLNSPLEAEYKRVMKLFPQSESNSPTSSTLSLKSSQRRFRL